MYHYSNMQHYPAEWQNYRFPPQDAYNDYYDPYYSTVYGTSSFNKHRKDKKNRHTSVSQDQYEFYDRNRDYYKELKRLKKQLNRPRSATNFRDTQNSIVLENGPLLMQPSSYVNYPMMMPDPMIDHQPGLGACTTDLMMPSQNDFSMVPPPMIQQQQPYYMQFPFFPNMMMPLFNNAMPTNQIKTDSTETTTEPAAAPVETTPVKEPSAEPAAIAPQPIQRRMSMMDSILSAFALPNTSDIPRPHSTKIINETTRQNIDPPTQQSSPFSSNQKTEIHLSPGSDRSSMKLHQKIHALQSRQYLWCYKAPSGMWVAFDAKNQAQIDAHSDKEDVLVLTKQSHVPGPLYISVKSKKAWYNAPNPIVFDVVCLPTEKSQFIVPPEPTVKRSKSLDMTSKLFSNVLNW